MLMRAQVAVCLCIPTRAGTRVCLQEYMLSRIPGPEDTGRTRRTFRESHLVVCHSIRLERKREREKEEVEAEAANRQKPMRREGAPKRIRVREGPLQNEFLVQGHAVTGSMLQEMKQDDAPSTPVLKRRLPVSQTFLGGTNTTSARTQIKMIASPSAPAPPIKYFPAVCAPA
jgi:hypothetical protein